MRDKLRKHEQNKCNKIIRALNKNLAQDSLWRGRFYVHQWAAEFERFDDNSGGYLKLMLDVRDKKTGMYKRFYTNNYDIRMDLWTYVNDFIVFDSHVWDDINIVKNDKTNYISMKWRPNKEYYDTLCNI